MTQEELLQKEIETIIADEAKIYCDELCNPDLIANKIIAHLNSRKYSSPEQEGGWISVEVAKPENDKEVLAIMQKFGNRSPEYHILTFENNKWAEFPNLNIERNPDYFTVTHWQPLPAPPSQQSVNPQK